MAGEPKICEDLDFLGRIVIGLYGDVVPTVGFTSQHDFFSRRVLVPLRPPRKFLVHYKFCLAKNISRMMLQKLQAFHNDFAIDLMQFIVQEFSGFIAPREIQRPVLRRQIYFSHMDLSSAEYVFV